MPFSRPTLTELQNQAAQDIVSNLDGGDALLRFSNLNVMAMVQAGMAHMQMGYLDYIALQCTPATATDEYLEAWGALKNISRRPISQATGSIKFSGSNGSIIPQGTSIRRSDGLQFVTTASATVSNSSVTVSAIAIADPIGLVGANGNSVANTQFTLANSIAGISSTSTSSTAFTGGADLETDDSLRTRVLIAFQNPIQGGDLEDYVQWALQVPGVTRAWCTGSTYGPGTVVVYVMFDSSESNNGGFPVGTNGVASKEVRASPATGDQLAVANYIFPLRPVTALVYVVSPTAQNINLSIGGVSTSNQAATTAAIKDLFVTSSSASPGGSISIASLWATVSQITGNTDFEIISPTTDIALSVGALPVLGTITWS